MKYDYFTQRGVWSLLAWRCGVSHQPARHRDPDRRREEIIAEIAALGPALPGSLVQSRNRGRRADCHCRADPPQLHGPSLARTCKVDGTTVTRSLSPEQAQR